MRPSRGYDLKSTFDAEARPVSPDPDPLPFLVADALDVAVEHPRPGVAVLRLAGEFDRTSAGPVRDRGDALLRSGHLLIIDMGRVTFFGSTGLGTLFVLREIAERHNTEVRLSDANHRAVLRPLLITGLDALFTFHPSIDDAIADRPTSL